MAAVGALIYTIPARAGGQIERIEIGTQMMTRDAGCRFDGENVFTGKALGALQPFPDGRLSDTADTAQRGLSTSSVNGGNQGFEGGRDRVHGLRYS